MRRRAVVLLMLLLFAAGAALIAFYYYYTGEHYVRTEDARVAADMVTVTPEVAGRLVEWQVREGETVKAGQVLGRQDLGSVLTSSAVNPQAMGTVAAVTAEKAVIKAPISGQVVQSKAVVGQMVSPGTALAVIADTSSLCVSANIKEKSIARVEVGQYVDVKLDAYPGRTFAGRVASIGQATNATFALIPAQNATGNFTKVAQVIPVKIQLLDAQDVRLAIGMSATVRIHVR